MGEGEGWVLRWGVWEGCGEGFGVFAFLGQATSRMWVQTGWLGVIFYDFLPVRSQARLRAFVVPVWNSTGVSD